MLTDLHPAASQPTTTPGITEQRQGNGGLAGTGLTDQRQDFTFFQGEAHALDDFYLTALATGDHSQVLDAYQLTHFNDLPNVDCVATTAGRSTDSHQWSGCQWPVPESRWPARPG
ncbi:hypothetical protein D3C80_1812030 [compost metagenome]